MNPEDFVGANYTLYTMNYDIYKHHFGNSRVVEEMIKDGYQEEAVCKIHSHEKDSNNELDSVFFILRKCMLCNEETEFLVYSPDYVTSKLNLTCSACAIIK